MFFCYSLPYTRARSSVVERCPDKTEVVSSILTGRTQGGIEGRFHFSLTATYKTEVPVFADKYRINSSSILTGRTEYGDKRR